RPTLRSFCNHQRDAALTQQLHKGSVEKALVPNLDRVSQGPIRVDGQTHSTLHSLVALASQTQCARRVLRQPLEECAHALGIESELRWKLPQNGPELVPQMEDARGEEVGQRRLHVTQPLHVSDESRAFDGKQKRRRCLSVPRPPALRT